MAGPNGDSVPDGTRIGAQLRAARLAARMSMAEVAEQAGLTKGFVSKLERDLANVSVASLIRLCDALVLTPSGEKRVQTILSDIEPGGGSGPEPYRLPAGVEFVFILAGQLQVTVAGERIVLEEGDALTFTADMEHTFVVPPRAGRARVLWVLSPALPDHGLELPPGGSG